MLMCHSVYSLKPQDCHSTIQSVIEGKPVSVPEFPSRQKKKKKSGDLGGMQEEMILESIIQSCCITWINDMPQRQALAHS